MAEAELIPYTEDELYVVPPKKAKSSPSKIVPMKVEKCPETTPAGIPPLAGLADINANTSIAVNTNNFFKENKTVIITTVVILVAVGIYFYLDHQRRLKEKKRRG